MGKPEQRFKCGAMEAAVFENEISRGGAKVKIKKVSFQKRYKAADGEWKSTNSFDANDIPKAVLVLNKAYEYLLTGERADESDTSESE